jgi:hypothetical protein
MDHPLDGRWPVSGYTRRVVVPKPRSRSGASTATCVFLLAAGAVFWFALPADPGFGMNLHVVGIIIACCGLLVLIWPRGRGLPVHPDRLRRWVIPSGTTGLGAGPPGGYAGGYGATPGDGQQQLVADLSDEPGRPTLADDLLGAEKDPPL